MKWNSNNMTAENPRQFNFSCAARSPTIKTRLDIHGIAYLEKLPTRSLFIIYSAITLHRAVQMTSGKININCKSEHVPSKRMWIRQSNLLLHIRIMHVLLG
jgi:hypothetical protein